MLKVVLLFAGLAAVVGWRVSARGRRRRWAALADDSPDGFLTRNWRQIPRPARRLIVTLLYAALGALGGAAYVALTRR